MTCLFCNTYWANVVDCTLTEKVLMKVLTPLVIMISPGVIDSNTKVVPLGTKGDAEGEEDLTAGQHVQKRFQETYTK